MSTKFFFTVIFSIFLLGSNAQSNKFESTLLRAVYGMEKKDLIAKHLKLEAAKSEIFWQMYEEYELARVEIGLKRIKNIERYAEKFDRLNDTDADAIMKASFEVNTEFINLWDRTYKKIAKSVSSATAAQFIQAEMFFEYMFRQELSMDIPLIGEFEIKEN